MPLVVAAIDFGTTFSGWAVLFKHEYLRDPLKASARQWSGGQTVSLKTPTSALISSDGKTLEAFGYEAESRYAEYAAENCHHKYYYFRRFKMMLHVKEHIDRDVQIKDENGKLLPALTVFSLSIKYLKDDLLNMSQSRITGGNLTDEDILWVLTVPAIWNDAAKQFMREAAQKAGVPRKKLLIALEPEAASIYCRHLPVKKLGSDENDLYQGQLPGKKSGSDETILYNRHQPVNKSDSDEQTLAKFSTGTKYLILDAGGGTVDVTVHEVMENGKVKELEKASGGAWGGIKVDEAFEEFLTEITGNPKVMKTLREKHMEDFLELFREFDPKKRDVRPNKTGKITFRIPISFAELVKKITRKRLEKTISKTKYKGKVEIVSDKLRVSVDVMKSLFDVSAKSVVDHVGSLLREPSVQGCEAILMVGGFSESPMLQTIVKTSFPTKHLIIPEDAGLAVFKVAAIYGHDPTTVAERICKFTYGVGSSHYRESCTSTHGPTRIECDEEGNLLCSNIFVTKATIGQSVTLDVEQKEHSIFPIHASQKVMYVAVYATSSSSPKLVTDEGCSKIGQLHVDIPDTSMGKKREFALSFVFGGTEIEVKVMDTNTGQIFRTFVDFLA